jgi:hypothetical protein
MKTTHRFLLAALVSTSLAAIAMPVLADPGGRGDGQQVADFEGDRGHGRFMGGPHGPGRGGPQGMAHFQGGPGGGRHGGPMGGPQFGGPMGGPGGPGAEMVIERFDVNDDGQITKEEVTTVTAEKVKTFDANADGSLSLEEYEALWTDAMNERIVRSFQFHDPDGNAQVTLDEYSDNFDKLFARFDRNDDGTIAADEFGPPHGGDQPGGHPGMGPGGPGNGPGGPDEMDDNG